MTMNKRRKLAEELAALKEADWLAVLKEARAKRVEREERRKNPEDPRPGMPPERFAAWIAWEHLTFDPELKMVMYLPANSPANEIRLLEISDEPLGPRTEPVAWLDVTPESWETEFQVFAADVSTEQWKRIRKGESLLPDGWSLEGARTFRRGN